MAIPMESNWRLIVLLIVLSIPAASCARLFPGTGPTRSYTTQEAEYFFEIALGSEYGSRARRITKWAGPVMVEIVGSPTREDREALMELMGEINAITHKRLLRPAPGGGSMRVFFVPLAEFPSYEPNYVEGNHGFFWVDWNSLREIVSARVLIASDVTTPVARAHLIREEVTQALGLMNDSMGYEDSIFYMEWSETTSYSELDRKVLEILYWNRMRPDMTPVKAAGLLGH